jgi:hypothetical protein
MNTGKVKVGGVLWVRLNVLYRHRDKSRDDSGK